MAVKLDPGIIQKLLTSLDEKLSQLGLDREIVTCGGGALLILGVIHRATRDLDVVAPKIDEELTRVAIEVANEFGLDSKWLNNGPSSLSKDLEKGWEARTQDIFRGQALLVKALGRRDLLASKLYAFCDRDEQDLGDILGLKPAPSEVESLREWLLERDGSAYWPARVEKQLALLAQKLQNGASNE
jgi:hypothetical protein